MQLPLNPQNSIDDDITNMILIKNELPISHSTAWTDFALIAAFHARLRLEERLAVEMALNVGYPNQLTRTWNQYKVICAQQVTIYRIAHPAVATAAAAKTVETVKTRTEFCFGCNQTHDPNTCAIVGAIVAAHPEYRQVLRAKRTDPIRIPQDGHTLLVPPGSALVFNTNNKNPTTRQNPDPNSIAAEAVAAGEVIKVEVALQSQPLLQKISLQTRTQPITMPTLLPQCLIFEGLGRN